MSSKEQKTPEGQAPEEIIMDQLDVEEDEVTMDANIQEDLDADSLDMVDLVMSVEEEFDLKIEDEDVEKIKTVGDIVSFIEAHSAEEE